jgi:hypothetical protein
MGNSDIQYRTSIFVFLYTVLSDRKGNKFRAKKGTGPEIHDLMIRRSRSLRLHGEAENTVEITGNDGCVPFVSFLVRQTDVCLEKNRIPETLIQKDSGPGGMHGDPLAGKIHSHFPDCPVVDIHGVHLVGIVKRVRREHKNVRLETRTCKAADVDKVFFELGAIHGGKGIVDTKVENENIRTAGNSIFGKPLQPFE